MQSLLNELRSIDWQAISVDWGGRILAAVLIFLIGRWVAKLLGAGVARLGRRTGLDEMLARFLAALTTISLTVVAAIFAVDRLGVDTTSLIAVLGAAGLAVGLALKDSLANFASSVMIMLFKPFRHGDFVEAAGIAGTVEYIGMFNTRLKTADNQVIVVPNSSITAANITNYTAEPLRRISVEIGISYADDIAKARQLILDVITADERYKQDPAPIVHTWAFADSSVNLMLRVWTETAIFWDARSDLLENIKKTFDANGISIPFPQRDVHLFNTIKD